MELSIKDSDDETVQGLILTNGQMAVLILKNGDVSFSLGQLTTTELDQVINLRDNFDAVIFSARKMFGDPPENVQEDEPKDWVENHDDERYH